MPDGENRKKGFPWLKLPKRQQKGEPTAAGTEQPKNRKWHLRDLIPSAQLFQRGIRRRWMVNSVGVVLSFVVLAIIAASVGLSNYYYSSMRTGMEARVREACDFFSSYASTEDEYMEMANYYITGFDDRDRLELQFIDTDEQRVILSSLSTYGLSAQGNAMTEDVTLAAETQEIGYWVGRDASTGERIMAVSAPIVNNGEVKGVMRLVTSLSVVDGQIIGIVLVVMLVGLLLVVMMYAVSIYFIKSIVDPIADITETANRIASGSYGVQIEKQNDDEIGDLSDAINDMSLKISQNEKMRSEFISSASHELRTPLTAINGWGETLLSGEITDQGEYQKGLGIIVSEGKRLAQMVEELLDFSRMEDGRFTLSMEPVDIKAEFEDAVFTYSQIFQKQGITLHHNDCEEEFDPIPGDPQRLRQVFCNLLDNAAKHGGSGGVIQTAIARLEDTVCISIRDYGPGIPEDELPFVKKKFYKGSSKARGNGIGLAVCDEIVTRHGGVLDISNAPGGGCLVRILLPLSAPSPGKSTATTGALPLEDIRAEMAQQQQQEP
ncbi:MAG: HAMP domain-containing histidine kinase [Clostridiales bacterium]|nr:HAMP domain-containing histidine kinase [Clostridiales bacterium]